MARRARRIALGLLLGLTAAAPAGPCAATEPTRAAAAVSIYTDAYWYRARPEPERRWHGVLHRRSVGAGPGGRAATSYGLKTADGELPVYAAGVGDRLAAFVGRRVAIVGKLVDLRPEGFASELWIATIAPE